MSAKPETQKSQRLAASGSKNKRSASRRGKRSKSNGLLSGIMELVWLTYFGRVFLFLGAAVILSLLNILLSQNQFDLFFRLLGIEMILTAVVFWLRFLLKKE